MSNLGHRMTLGHPTMSSLGHRMTLGHPTMSSLGRPMTPAPPRMLATGTLNPVLPMMLVHRTTLDRRMTPGHPVTEDVRSRRVS
jgi:hypothetical protein